MVCVQPAESMATQRSRRTARDLHGRYCRHRIVPAPKCQDLCGLVLTVVVDIYIGMAFAIWIILPISFAVGGIMYMLGGANPGLLEKAKKTLWGAVIGTVIVLGSYLLIATFVKFIQIGYIGGFSPGSPSACTL